MGECWIMTRVPIMLGYRSPCILIPTTICGSILSFHFILLYSYSLLHIYTDTTSMYNIPSVVTAVLDWGFVLSLLVLLLVTYLLPICSYTYFRFVLQYESLPPYSTEVILTLGYGPCPRLIRKTKLINGIHTRPYYLHYTRQNVRNTFTYHSPRGTEVQQRKSFAMENNHYPIARI